jgi:hypothetical protein
MGSGGADEGSDDELNFFCEMAVKLSLSLLK